MMMIMARMGDRKRPRGNGKVQRRGREREKRKGHPLQRNGKQRIEMAKKIRNACESGNSYGYFRRAFNRIVYRRLDYRRHPNPKLSTRTSVRSDLPSDNPSTARGTRMEYHCH